MLDPVVNRGTTFCDQLITGLIDPTYKHPDDEMFELIQTLIKLNVPVDVLVFCGASMFPTGLAEATAALVPLVTAQPVAPVDRSVATLAYWA